MRVTLHPDTGILVCTGRYEGRPCFTAGMMGQLTEACRYASVEPGVRSVLWRMDHPTVFALGGDLAMFARAIRQRDEAMLREYGAIAIEGLYAHASLFCDHDVETVACVHGDAYGGGFEAVLSATTIVAERGVRMGFPEIGFDLFPGMGAFNFLSTRVGPFKARRMILDPRGRPSEELFELGVVDILADRGSGVEKATSYLEERSRETEDSRLARRARARELLPSRAVLDDTVLAWARTAMSMGDRGLRKIERLVGAQDRLDRPLAATT